MSTARPVERYGAPRPWVRRATIVGVVVLAVIGAAWLLWAAAHHSRPDVTARVTSFDVVDERRVTATIELDRPPGVAATCLLQAQAPDHGIVGELQATMPASSEQPLNVTYQIPTERLATAVVVDGCTSAEPARPR
ncbi:MAG: DUF4307 domain-containing protein [Actinomycetota bacterium]|nr:DUF4307 domain-containing protein [Actinomycetota bacterium]